MTGRGGSAARAAAKTARTSSGDAWPGLESAPGAGAGARVRGVQHDLAPALLDDDGPGPTRRAREEHDEVGARGGAGAGVGAGGGAGGAAQAARQHAGQDGAGEEAPPAATASRRSHERRTPCRGRRGSPPGS